MDHKKSYRILCICGMGSLVMLLLAYELSKDRELLGAAKVLLVLGAVINFTALIQAFFFYRCPHCGASFNIRFSRPVRCPRCGKRIDW